MAEKDAEVGEHARNVSRANDCTAVSTYHRVLKAAGARGEIDAEDVVAVEQGDSDAKQNGLQKEGDPVTAPKLESAVLNQKAAQHRARHKRADNGGKVEHRRTVESCQGRRQHGRSAGKVSNGLMLEAQ